MITELQERNNHFPEKPLPSRHAGSFSEDRPLGWDPVAEGNRAGDGMACNNSDHRQWRKQGAVVGAAASKMQAIAKQMLGAATRISCLRKKATGASALHRYRFILPQDDGAVGRAICRPVLAGAGFAGGDGMACNNSDHRQWRKQGAVVGAAASKMQAIAKQMLGAATRISCLRKKATGASALHRYRFILPQDDGAVGRAICRPVLAGAGFAGGDAVRQRLLHGTVHRPAQLPGTVG